MTIEEIAASEGISRKWAQERKAAILAERTIDRPHEFIQLQIRRLNEAMLVAYSSMTTGNVKAVDQVIKVVRELERYQGSALTRMRRGSPCLRRLSRRSSPCRSPLWRSLRRKLRGKDRWGHRRA